LAGSEKCFSALRNLQKMNIGLVNRASPTWITMAQEIDGTHSVYIEQRHFDPETCITTTNQGLCFSTDDWHIFALQVSGIDAALKQGLKEDVLNQHLLHKNLSSMLSEGYTSTGSDTKPPPLQAIAVSAAEIVKKKRTRPAGGKQ
jgi:hypothetical protein